MEDRHKWHKIQVAGVWLFGSEEEINIDDLESFPPESPEMAQLCMWPGNGKETEEEARKRLGNEIDHYKDKHSYLYVMIGRGEHCEVFLV